MDMTCFTNASGTRYLSACLIKLPQTIILNPTESGTDKENFTTVCKQC